MLTRMPLPLSCICNSFMPPSLTVIRIDVDPASRLFSSNSLRADEGLCMILFERKFSGDDALVTVLWAYLSCGYSVYDRLV